MATTVTKVIDPDMGSGYDYDSLFDCEAAQQGDLTGARNEIAVAKCRCTGGTADTTAVTIDGWTTSAIQCIKIWADPAESYRHSGKWETGNKYRFFVTGETATIIFNHEEYVKFDGLQIKSDTSSGRNIYTETANLPSQIDISNCYIETNCGYGIYDEQYIRLYRIWNCIFNDTHSEYYPGGAGIWINAYSSGEWIIYNCTFNDHYGGIHIECGSVSYIKNCLFVNCDTDLYSNISKTDTYCATDNNSTLSGLNSSGGTYHRFSQTFSFVGAADFHLASNDAGALGYGLNLYNDAIFPFQDDIDGQDRGGASASWDIGADQWIPTDSCAWGHDTGVTQDNIRNFTGKWYGTGEVLLTGDSEKIELAAGEYMISEPVIVAVDSTCTVLKDSYFGGGGDANITLSYRTAATPTALSSASWTAYTVPFTSLGYAQLKASA